MRLHIAYQNRGYTLIELLVVISLLMITGSVVVGILSSAFNGNAKSKITNDLAQNGNYALSIISDIVLNSQNFQSITDSTPTTYTVCTPGGISGLSVSVVGFDGGVTSFACNGDTISSNRASLLDTSRVQLVPGTCKFTCVQADAYSPPRIDITFQLKDANASVSDAQGVATFNTSLSLRNQALK